MKGFKSKKGISLIVLVITIIVMIILAAAIILSLNNSGIIDKANKAKQDSDTANLKEYVNILEAEYELMTETEKAGKTSIEYVNSKLAEKGYKRRLNEDGILLTENAVDAIDAGIQIGDEVKYTVTENKYTPDEDKTGTSDYIEHNTELTAQTNLTWIYVGVSEDGELLITPDVSEGVPANSDVVLYGVSAYLKGPEELNAVCDKLYTTTKGTARSMNIDDVTRILGYTGEKGAYYDDSNDYQPTTEAKKIGDIEKELGRTLSNRYTPSSKNLEDYYSDFYCIKKTDDVKEMKNSKYVNLIYPASDEKYWLASTCVYAKFRSSEEAFFSMRSVNSNAVSSLALFVSGTASNGDTFAVRPVVSLTSKIQISSTTESGAVWEFSAD